MIVIYHQYNKVVEIQNEGETIVFTQGNITKALFEIAISYSNDLIIWCHVDFKSNLNLSTFQDVFHHRKIMASYSPFQNSFLSKAIGYVEESPFIKINKKVCYPTWQMSSYVGGMYAEVLLALKDEVSKDSNFDYFLHSMAKLSMPNGLLCYSDPRLLKDVSGSIQPYKNDNFTLYRFVKQHYKTRWVFLLFLNFFLYERKITILPFITSLFYYRKKLDSRLLDKIEVQSTNRVVETGTIDVIIPTIGRKQYLYDVLKDLSKQTHLPKNVIIVEQNPNPESVSELNYILEERWPFIIKHTFTHQAGACNARNLALAEVESEWVFMADDDIRIESNFLAEVFSLIEKEGSEQITVGCYEPYYPQKNKSDQKVQWNGFGSGCSVVKLNNIKSIRYNSNFEFGYGEDTDFGMQLRNLGYDILFSPKPEIVHLKAPIGGFRTKPVLAWHKDLLQPKPSPTVMLYKIMHLSNKQINGYKTILFFKYYRYQNIKNPIRYLISFRKQWEQSVYWAKELRK